MRPFDDLAAFAAAPRLAGLALSADGTRRVTTLQPPDAKGSRYTSARSGRRRRCCDLLHRLAPARFLACLRWLSVPG